MAYESIVHVLLKEHGRVKRIELEDMTKSFFRENRENIFCPNELCNAKIEYCEGNKRTFFRTKRSRVEGEYVYEEHVEGCPYGIDHNLGHKPKTIYDPNIGYLIDDNHIKKSLERAFRQHKDPEYGKSKKRSKKRAKEPSNISTVKEEVITRGKGVIGVNEENSTGTENTRQPYLYQRFIDDIGEKDFDNSRLVKGNIIGFVYEDSYISILLETSTNLRARIFFSEQYRVDNPQPYEQIKYYEKYYNEQLALNQKVFIACAGDVKKDNFDISVNVRSYKHINIDGKEHFELLRRYW